jgi:hypothetical protein
MRCSLLIVVVVAAVAVACSGEKAQSTAATAATPAVPPPLPATKAIFEGYAKSPASFDRLPHLSRFYIEDNQRKDAACATGDGGAACHGDRFVCLERAPAGAGSVVEARVAGEQAGVSATVKLKLAFADASAAFDVDVVYEAGSWKVDQVRCP